ncbi:MAG TPA: hypothetical protein VLC97_06435 [Rhodanobacteraceae bacterium]|nr:hypothetical protein [Rhodanobacteraceae bacterium]
MFASRRVHVSSLLALAAGCFGQVTHAEVDRALDDISVSVGAFANNSSATLRADGAVLGSGTPLDFDRDLGQGGTKALPYFDVTWRPWEHHEFEFSYFSESNSQTSTLSRNIMFNGKEFIVGSRLASKFSVDAGSITYRYWAWTSDDAAFGIFGGLQWYSISLDVNGTVGITGSDGGVTQTGSASAKVSSTLPDPSLGLSYRYQMADWARLVADGGGFKIKVENVDATLYNARVGVEFYPWTNFGVVTQYTYNKIEADVERTNFLGNADIRFSGFQVLLKARF